MTNAKNYCVPHKSATCVPGKKINILEDRSFFVTAYLTAFSFKLLHHSKYNSDKCDLLLFMFMVAGICDKCRRLLSTTQVFDKSQKKYLLPPLLCAIVGEFDQVPRDK